MSTSGGIMSTSGGYHEYIGGCSVLNTVLLLKRQLVVLCLWRLGPK